MAKLNGASSLSTQAQDFLVKYKALINEMAEAQATEATIAMITKSYYTEMGGVGSPPPIPTGSIEAPDDVTDNVTAFRRPKVQPPKSKYVGSDTKPKLPVALIFVCLIVVYVGLRYYLG